MFTGIVERSLSVIHVAPRDGALRLALPNVWSDVKHGESLCVNGVCLTVAELSADRLGFDVIRETLDFTNLGLLKAGEEVHVERSLRVGDRFDGHMVQGHVDGTATIVDHRDDAGEWRTIISTPLALAKYLIPKGSITLDGVSLTLAAINDETFEVALIPTTLSVTRLANRPIGWPLNVECDMMVKTIVEVVSSMQSAVGRRDAEASPSRLSTADCRLPTSP